MRRTRTLLALGPVCAASGAVALGWLFRNPDLVRLHPSLAPMPMKAALALLATVVGLVAAERAGRWRWLAAALGAAVFALAAVTLVEHTTGRELGIDQAVVADWLGGEAVHPARMAPNVAAALALVGAGLLLGGALPFFAALLGGLCAALGINALLGFVTGIDAAPGWEVATRVPPSTALCLTLVGGFLAASRLVTAEPGPGAARAPRRVSQWSALVVGVAAASVTLLFWQALRQWEEAQHRSLVTAGARRVAGEVRSRLELRMEALAILSQEWEGRLFRTRGRWESDVRLILSQSPGLIAVEWIETDGTVDWVYPGEVELPVPDVAGLLASPERMRRPALLGPFELSDSEPAFRIVAPLVKPDGIEGWLAGTFRSRDLFGEIQQNLDAAFAADVYAGNVLLSPKEPRPSEGTARRVVWRELGLPGMDIRVRVEPAAATTVGTARSLLPPALLAGGLAMSLLLGVAFALRNVAASRARAHDAAAQEVRRLNVGLESRVEARTADLARSNAELKEFASFLSHELRQPLSTQAIWIELLAAHCGGVLDDEGRHQLAELRAVTRQLGALLEAQLAVSAITRTEFEPTPVDLTSLAQEVVRDLKSDLDAVGGSVEIAELPALEGSLQQLRQLMRNLLENAIKYRSAERPLRVQIEGEVAGDWAVVRIRDNGRGFAPAEAQRIFDTAVRLHPDGAPGRGIGLALCRRIATLHAGTIAAEGWPGQGAVFQVRLPRGRSRG